MYHVFIGYSHKDSDCVYKLEGELKRGDSLPGSMAEST